MKRILTLVFVFIAVGAGVFFAGPRVTVEPQTRAVQLPADLERYLADSEARYTDITPGAEKTIVWAHPDKRQTDLAIIYLHGYSATRQETAPLSDQLARQLGANLFYTRLSGHGRGGAAMSSASANDWLQDSQEALQIGQRLGKKVLVIGTSTGATLATWLALQADTQRVLAYVLVSPNFAPKDPASSALAWPWAAHFVPLLLGDEYQWQPRNAQQARYWSHRYPVQALLPMMALVNYVREQPLEQISAPLLLQSTRPMIRWSAPPPSKRHSPVSAQRTNNCWPSRTPRTCRTMCWPATFFRLATHPGCRQRFSRFSPACRANPKR